MKKKTILILQFPFSRTSMLTSEKGMQSREMFAPGILGSFGTTVQMSSKKKKNQTLKKDNPKFSQNKNTLKQQSVISSHFCLVPKLILCHHSKIFQMRITQSHQIPFNITYLLLCLGNFKPYSIGLTSFIAWRTWQAVEAWICVHTAMDLIHLKANIWHSYTLQVEKEKKEKPIRWLCNSQIMNFSWWFPDVYGNKANTSSRSSQKVPLPRYPAGHAPHDQDPSG